MLEVKLARRLGLAPLGVVVLLAAGPGLAQTTDSPLVAELKRYLNDGAAIAMAPSGFEVGDWAEVAAISGGEVFVGTRDDRIDAWVQGHRSKQTEDFARVVKPFGTWAAIGVSVVALGGGLVSHNEHLLETGRDAVEAEILAAGITTPPGATLAALPTLWDRPRIGNPELFVRDAPWHPACSRIRTSASWPPGGRGRNGCCVAHSRADTSTRLTPARSPAARSRSSSTPMPNR